MEVGIAVKGVKVTSHTTHQISCMSKEASTESTSKRSVSGTMQLHQRRLAGSQVGLLSLGPLQPSQDLKERPRVAQRRSAKRKDLSGCCRLPPKCPRCLEPSEDAQARAETANTSALERSDVTLPTDGE